MTVIGTGYLGVTHAACLAEMGYEVIGLDTDEAKVAMLTDGRVPFYEPDLEPLLRKHIDSGRLRFTTSYAEAAAFGDVHFICVGTPQRADGPAADLRFVRARSSRSRRSSTGPALVVGKSTVPVGTARWVADRLKSSRRRATPSTSSGTRSSSARASRCRTRFDPTGW